MMATETEPTAQQEDELVPGLTRELLHDGRFLVLNFHKWVSRKVVDGFCGSLSCLW